MNLLLNYAYGCEEKYTRSIIEIAFKESKNK